MGIFDIINVPLGFIMRIAYMFTNNYVLAILLFALIMQVVLSPFGIKQQKNSIRQAKLAPKVAAIRKKYAGRTDQATQKKMQEETMELYQREKFNPASGCLPLLIQLPILFSLYAVVTKPLTYISRLSDEAVTVLANLTGTDISSGVMNPQLKILKALDTDTWSNWIAKDSSLSSYSDSLIPRLDLFGMDLSIAPNEAGSLLAPIMIIPVLTFVALIASQLIIRKFSYQPIEQKEAQNNLSMKIMTYSMPLLSAWFAYKYAAAIGIYWIFRNVLQTLQQLLFYKVMPTPKFTEEDYRAAERELAGSAPKKKPARRDGTPSGERQRSLHHIDDDDDYEALSAAAPSAKHEEDAASEANTADAPKLKEDKSGSKFEKRKK